MVVKSKNKQIGSILKDFESLWQKLDQIFDSLNDSDWTKKHGADWLVQDVPYHLSYFDKEVVATAIKVGPKYPKSKQKVFKTLKELNSWNAQMFRKKPKKQTPQQSLKQMKQSREAIRKVLANMTDKDLSKPAFSFLPGFGWSDVETLLGGGIAHTWSHLQQLRLHLGLKEPLPEPETVKKALAFYMGFLGTIYNKKEAQKVKKFTAVMDFKDAGPWTFKISKGQCQVSKGKSSKADLIMSQTSETFLKTFAKMQSPLIAMLTGKIKVTGFKNMATFGKIFAEPKLDQEIEPQKL